jgi:hypothetical protein
MRLASVYKSGERPGDWLKIKRSGAVPAERVSSLTEEAVAAAGDFARSTIAV